MPPPLPWITAQPADPTRDYVVMASYLPLRRRSATPRFLRMVLAVRRQLRTADGLTGYSLYARPLAGQYWTLSAWTDRAAMQRFVQAEPHATVMTALSDAMGPTRFVQWTSSGAQLPPDWDTALARLDGPANQPPAPPAR